MYIDIIPKRGIRKSEGERQREMWRERESDTTTRGKTCVFRKGDEKKKRGEKHRTEFSLPMLNFYYLKFMFSHK